MTMEDCIPCANCGSNQLKKKLNGIGQPYIRCGGCINFSLPAPTFDMAVAEWNRKNRIQTDEENERIRTMTEEKKLVYLPVELLDPHPNNPRKDLGDLSELTNSIKANGVLQNLTVVSKPLAEGGGQYTVIIGHRRLAAAKLAGLSTVPCVVMQMSEIEQIRTMAIENMHRTDLTPIEQADSFQMMLDLGDTVQTIADNTGFSETTVRRRLNLLDYDRTKLEAASERGGTLQDYMELQKIKDPDRRNRVLDAIGTTNFKYVLERNLDDEKREENRAYYIGELKKFAKQFPKKENPYNGNWDGVRHYNLTIDRIEVEIPKDADKTEYFYTNDSSFWSVSLYKRKAKEKAQREKKTPEQIAWERWYKEATETITETAKLHKKLRLNFVSGLSEGSLIKKKPLSEIVTMQAVMWSGYSGIDIDKYWISDFVKNFYNIAEDAYSLTSSSDPEKKAKARNYADMLRKEPTKLLLCTTIAALEGHRDFIPFWMKDYRAGVDSYKDAEERDLRTLRAEYEFLEKLGYEISDEEKKTMNGEFLKELLDAAPEMPGGGE